MTPPTLPSGAATLDDPGSFAAYTAWATGPGGERLADSHFRLEGLYCAACAGVVEAALRAEPGVVAVEVGHASRRARVRWQPAVTRPSRLVAAVRRAGYDAAPALAEPARALREREQRQALWRLFVAAFCMMQVMMYAAPAYVAEPGTLAPDLLRLLQWASWLLSLPVLLFSAAPIFREAWAGLRQGRPRMDLPVALGLLVTFLASSAATFAPGGAFGHEVYFDSLTMFVAFLLAGRWLTLRAQHKVAAALEDACARLPNDVRRVGPGGAFAMVALGAVAVGDRLRVLAGEAFAADGPLLEGRTEVDEALLTGESRPRPRGPGDAVVAGSLNVGAPVTMRVERLGGDTRFEGIAALMREALTQRPALTRAADRLAPAFLWGVLLLAAAAGAAWSFVDPARAVRVAVSVLIVTCPCALSLAAPSVWRAAAGALARRGVLVRRLEALEALARVDQVFFDKTGTLTEGELRLARVVPLPAARAAGLDDATVLQLAAALARHSAHPLSRALAAADAGPGAVWSDVREVSGCGVEGAAWDGSRARLGALAWVDPGAAPAAPATAARLWFGDARGVLAGFEFDETLKPDAQPALAALRGQGVALALLSGDSPERVRALAVRLGLADARGAATPELKLAAVAEAQAGGRCVAMVGDGVNDAPVVARADVSFVFAQGAEITRSGADFVLLSARVADVAWAHRVARDAMRVLRQNLAWAVGYNAVCVPLALFGAFPPWVAGLGMAGSSLFVVLNALRVGTRAGRS